MPASAAISALPERPRPLGGDEQPLDGEQEVLDLGGGGTCSRSAPHRQAHIMSGQPETPRSRTATGPRIGICPHQARVSASHFAASPAFPATPPGVCPPSGPDRGTIQVVQARKSRWKLGAAGPRSHEPNHLPQAFGVVLAGGSRQSGGGGTGRRDDPVERLGGQVGSDERVLCDRAHVITAGPEAKRFAPQRR